MEIFELLAVTALVKKHKVRLSIEKFSNSRLCENHGERNNLLNNLGGRRCSCVFEGRRLIEKVSSKPSFTSIMAFHMSCSIKMLLQVCWSDHCIVCRKEKIRKHKNIYNVNVVALYVQLNVLTDSVCKHIKTVWKWHNKISFWKIDFPFAWTVPSNEDLSPMSSVPVLYFLSAQS